MGLIKVKYQFLIDSHVSGKLIPRGSLLQLFVYFPNAAKVQRVWPTEGGFYVDQTVEIWPPTPKFTGEDLLIFAGHVNGGYFGGKVDGVVLWKEKFYGVDLANFQVVQVPEPSRY